MIPTLVNSLGNTLIYSLAFVFVISIVIFIHELGHFLVARWCGVKVAAFSIGMGQEIWSRVDRHGTRWRIAALPIGGYVKWIDDEDPASMRASKAAPTGTPQDREGHFRTKPVWQRAAIVAAGPLANFILAILIFAVTFSVYGVRTVEPKIDEVVVGSPADKAGLKAGDVFVSIDGRPVRSFGDIFETVSISGGRVLRVVIDRAGKSMEFGVAPVLSEASFGGHKQQTWLMGVRQTSSSGKKIKEETVNPAQAVMLGFERTGVIVNATLSYLSEVITLRRSADQLGGPARIADVAGKVAKQNPLDLLLLAGLLSISVGLFNLFPIPPLDGGHLLFYGIESIRGKPLDDSVQEIGFSIGIAMVLTLVVVTFWNDIPIIRAWFS